MSRLKKEILSKLKEYAGKMGKDHLGGDDSPSPKRGGLRDFDGYDNVDYNKDMPMDEDSPESAHPQGSKKLSGRTTVMDMLDVISHKEFGPDYHKLSTKQKKEVHKLAIKGKLIKQSTFKESVNEADITIGGKEYNLKKSGSKITLINKKLSADKFIFKNVKDFKAWADDQVEPIGGTQSSHFGINEGYSKHSTYDEVVKSIVDFAKSKGYKIPSKGLDIIKGNPPSGPIRGWSRGTSIPLDKKINLSFDIYGVGKVFTVNQRLKLNKTFAESVNEAYVVLYSPKKGVKPVSTAAYKDKKDAEKWAKDLGGITMIVKKKIKGIDESLEESMFSMIDQIRQDSKDVRDFVKNVFKDREFKKMSNDKEFIKYLKSIYEGIDESKGVPSNYMSGRTSDYHTALRGKNRDYSGGTNFKKKNHGQPDVAEEDEDQETNQLSNKQIHVKAKLKVAESGKKKSEKNYKDWKSTNEGFDNVEHLSLLNKALRAIPGSKKQKDIIKKLNIVRKSGGMKPLKELSIVEYGQRLDLSFIEDEESKLDGTYPSTDAIDRELDEGRPIPMDTPNELVYLDFKKYAYKNRSMFKRELIKNKDNGGKMFLTLSALWYKWARKDNKEFTHIKDKLKFGRALMIMMVNDDIIFDKKAWKKTNKITNLKELDTLDQAFLKAKPIDKEIDETAKRDYKDEYKKFQSSKKSKKYRAELNKYNRDKGTYGNGDGKDASHKGGKIVGFESASKNRGRKEKSRLKKK